MSNVKCHMSNVKCQVKPFVGVPPEFLRYFFSSFLPKLLEWVVLCFLHFCHLFHSKAIWVPRNMALGQWLWWWWWWIIGDIFNDAYHSSLFLFSPCSAFYFSRLHIIYSSLSSISSLFSFVFFVFFLQFLYFLLVLYHLLLHIIHSSLSSISSLHAWWWLCSTWSKPRTFFYL